VGAVYNALDRHAAVRRGERYLETGLELDVEVEARRLDELKAALGDATRGRAIVEPREP
jgi:hypothetical protein